MSLYTNTESHGGSLKTQIASDLRKSETVNIASGYVSASTIKSFEPSIKKLVRNGGKFNLIVGMGYFEGLAKRIRNSLEDLHGEINKIDRNAGGVKLVYSRRYHGKIYHFEGKNIDNVYVGSSNFSDSGLGNFMEATVLVNSQESKNRIKKYFKWLNSPGQSAYIDKVEMFETDSQRFRDEIVNAKMGRDQASRYDISTLSLNGLDYVDIPLSRNIDKQSKSNFNVYFGKGRWTRGTGKILKRDWFEIELIVGQDICKKHPVYPRGEFTAITDDGYTFRCETQSASNNYKNLRSKNGLNILGKWIKTKLQNAGALQPLMPVTGETFDKYGTDILRLYKISEDAYFMEFKPR